MTQDKDIVVHSSESQVEFNFHDLNIEVLSNYSTLVLESTVNNDVQNFSFTSTNGTNLDLKFIYDLFQWKSTSNNSQVILN